MIYATATDLVGFELRMPLTGLGKYHPFRFDGDGPKALLAPTATDLDRFIIEKSSTAGESWNLFDSSSIPSPCTSHFLLLLVVNTDQKLILLRLTLGRALLFSGAISASRDSHPATGPPTNLDLERRKGTATDRDFRNDGSVSRLFDKRTASALAVHGGA